MGVPVLISRFYKAANEYRRAIRLYLFSSVQELTSLSILGHEFAKANSLLRGTTAIRGGAELTSLSILGHEFAKANSLLHGTIAIHGGAELTSLSIR